MQIVRMRLVISFLLLGAMSSFVGAVREGDAAAVKQMLAHGADPNAPEGVNDWTPLLHAIHKNQIVSVQALLDGGADPNRAVNSLTPLMMAAGYGYTPIVKVLLARGANPRLRDLDDLTAVDYALRGSIDIDRFTLFQCDDDTVRALIAANAPRTVATRSRRWASLKGCPSVSLVR
jgi:ankyrin repeat protein